jgi:hypothetical protein
LAREPLALNAFLSEEIPSWILHVRSWLIDNNNASQSIFVTQYEKLMSDPQDELEFILADSLGIIIAKESMEYGVRASRLGIMRASEKIFTDRNPVNAKFELNFVRPKDEREVDGFTPEIVAMIRDRTQKTYDAARERLR